MLDDSDDVGLVLGAKREYQWVGDKACDLAKSDIPRWIKTGHGLVPIEGAVMTTFVCEPLRPDVFQMVQLIPYAKAVVEPSPDELGGGTNSMLNSPAMSGAIVAFAVREVRDGKPAQWEDSAYGKRLSDEYLTWLWRRKPVRIAGRWKCAEHTRELRKADCADCRAGTEDKHLTLISHLSLLLMRDNRGNPDEGKE